MSRHFFANAAKAGQKPRSQCFSQGTVLFATAQRIASFIDLTKEPMLSGACVPFSSRIFTIAEPTITPSAAFAISAACSGVEIPNPIAHGTSVTSRILDTTSESPVAIDDRIPVTPMLETI